MRYSGIVTELDLDLDDYDFDVIEAVVTKDRIAIDWKEDDQVFHVLAHSDDGVTYRGNYGSPRPIPEYVMEFTKYTSADKGLLLLAKWYQTDNGNEGSCFFELDPA